MKYFEEFCRKNMLIEPGTCKSFLHTWRRCSGNWSYLGRNEDIRVMLEGDLDDKLLSSNPPLSTSTPTNVEAPDNLDSAVTGSSTNAARYKSLVPYKWNLFFTGWNSNESVNSFLSESRGISKRKLFVAGRDLFKGPVWNWYLKNHHSEYLGRVSR